MTHNLRVVDEQRTLRTPFYWVSLIVALWSAVILPLTIGLIVAPEAGGISRVIGSLLTVVALFLGIRIARTRVVFDQTAITRKGPIWSRTARWEEIDEIEIVRDPQLGLMGIANVRLSSGANWRLGLIRFGKKGREELQASLVALRAHHRFQVRPRGTDDLK